MNPELSRTSSQAIATWLLVGVGMLIVQILLGGITRLTGSGLSITEWKVVTGTLPPLNHDQWLVEFDRYRQTPQYQLLNSEFTLKDFKFIFFWEWLHRIWARLIGVAFLIPFIVFLVRRRFRPSMVKPLLILFLLGALQGAVGWIMVASGLTGDAIYVKPTRLALHFMLALGLLCYTFWFALQLIVPPEKRTWGVSEGRFTLGIIAVLVIQLIFGALMAGHKAALAAPTWPDINGELVPVGMISRKGAFLDIIENKITLHFIHRGLGYLLLLLTVWLTLRLFKINSSPLLRKTRWWPLFLVFLQVIFGVLTVLCSLRILPNHWGVFEWMAQLHQLIAILILLSLVWVYYLLGAVRYNPGSGSN